MTKLTVQEMDARIVDKAIADFLAAGFALGVNDGEVTTVRNCRDAVTVRKAMMSTDEDYLHVYKDGKMFGWVRFIYGEYGWDVICDHTTNLEPYLAGCSALSDQFEAMDD